jgi:hypothetical protein
MNPELDPQMTRLLNDTINNASFTEDEAFEAFEAIQAARGATAEDAQLNCGNESTNEYLPPQTTQLTPIIPSTVSSESWIVEKGWDDMGTYIERVRPPYFHRGF